MTSPKIFFKIFKGRDLISLPYFYYPYCNKKSINFLIKRRTKMDTPIAAAIHIIEKNVWKITWLSIAYETALFIVSPSDYLLILHYTISLYFSILHFLYFLYLLVVFLLKYDILSLTSYITKFLTHVYYTYYNIIILTIPEWLNNEALRLNLNFSQVLQEALLTKIQSHWTIPFHFLYNTSSLKQAIILASPPSIYQKTDPRKEK